VQDAKEPEGQTGWGVFLWLLFFAQAKKVTRQQAKKGFSKPEETSINKLQLTNRIKSVFPTQSMATRKFSKQYRN